MARVQIETTQHVAIDYEVASVSDRILATMVDLLIQFGYFMGMLVIFDLLPQLGGWAGLTVMLLPIFFYELVSEVAMDGQTLGKKALQIKVVKVDGTQPGLGSYLLRWLIRLAEVTMFQGALALAAIIINGRGQRLGDMAAGTCVIKLNPRVELGDTIFKALEEHHQVRYPEVERLSDADVAVIKDVIQATYTGRRSVQVNVLIRKTQEAIARKMGVETDEKPLPFLQTVLKDYNHLMGRLTM